MQRVVCPGSFDPVTNGHLDIIGRAAGLYDEVVVAVLINITKKSLFTVDERVDMLREVTKGYGNVRVERFHGLLVDFCAANGISAVVKGLRAVSDFEYEMQMAQMNYRLAKIETLFMTTNPLYSFLSSSLIKDVARYGGDVSALVPEQVLDLLRARLAEECRPKRLSAEQSPGGCTLIGRFTHLLTWRITVMSKGNAKPAVHADGFRFDMRVLGRGPGEFRDEKRSATAPEGLGSGLVLVPAGGDVDLDLRFEAVSEGVLVTGSAVAPMTGECARCLDPLTTTVEVSFQELYRYLPDPGESGEDGEERFLDGDFLDLEPAFRDAVVLALPLSPLCSEDCAGLCVECGAKLAEAGPDHGHGERVDPRWGALAKLDFDDRTTE